mgnify:CR=1 FL=1
MIIIKYILIFILYIKINSLLYLSIYVYEVDDCIYKLYSYKESKRKDYFNFLENHTESTCNPNYLDYGNPLILDEPYEIGDIIYMEVKDKLVGYGYVNITVKINEYNIKARDQKFWKCLNCHGNNSNYYFDNIFKFYKSGEGNAKNESLYNFTFQINSFSELYNYNFEINNSFYELSGNTFNLILNNTYNELELINFNTTDYFYISNNKNLSVNYTNYYFKVHFDKNIGNLKGLNLDNCYTNITNNGSFKINKTNGLIYQLSSEDKRNYGAYLQLKITAYNIYSNKTVTKEKSFIFNITLTDYLKCLNEKREPDSENIFHYICQNLTQEKLDFNISEFILRIEKNKKYEINGSDVNIYISPINSMFLKIQ